MSLWRSRSALRTATTDNVPIRSSSFQAPGTPFNIYGGLKVTLWQKK